MTCGRISWLLASLLSLLPFSADAVIVDVSGSLAIDFPADGTPGISLAQPIVTTSDFDAESHSLAAIIVGVQARADGSIDSGLYRLPYLERLELDATALRAGSVEPSGAITGLEVDLTALVLEGADVYSFGIRDQTDAEAVRFADVELGGTAALQSGVLDETHSPIGTASLESRPWIVSSNTLDAYGSGALELEAPITISSDVQSGDPVSGIAKLSLVFVPEPSLVLMVCAGCLWLGRLGNRSLA